MRRGEIGPLLGALLGSTLSAAVLLNGCGRSDQHAHDHVGEQTDASGAGHHHAAPHGGTLVMLGNHAYQLELLGNAESGELALYVLDGGAERFVRIDPEILSATAHVDGETFPLQFEAVANPATGETVGDTSHFIASAPWLREHQHFTGAIGEIEIEGRTFTEVSFPFPEGSH